MNNDKKLASGQRAEKQKSPDTSVFPPRNNESIPPMTLKTAVEMADINQNKMNRIRQWEPTNLGENKPKVGLEVTIMTYNILSQAAIDSNPNLYRKCKSEYLSEGYRVTKLFPEIIRSSSDIICLQEVEQFLYNGYIRPVFQSKGYESIFNKLTGDKNDGCAILWRRAKFHLIRHHVVEYRSSGDGILDRHNVGLIAVLKPHHLQAYYTQLHVATTHLQFNPRKEDEQFCQLKLLLSELERSAHKDVCGNEAMYHPTILCGDFDFEPHSPLYRFVETGHLDTESRFSRTVSRQREGRNDDVYLNASKSSMEGLMDEFVRFCRSNKSVPQKPNFNRAPGTSLYSKNTDKSCDISRPEKYRLLSHTTSLEDSATKTSSNSLIEDHPESSSDSDISSNSESSQKLGLHFASAYKYQKDSNEYPITCMIGDDCSTVDHIFYNVLEKNSKEDKLVLLETYSLPSRSQLAIGDEFPNAYLGSDHLCLMSKFMLTFKDIFDNKFSHGKK